MPDNDFNNLPKLNNKNETNNETQVPVNNNQNNFNEQPQQEKIVIPQEYYDKLEKERQEKEAQAQQEMIAAQESKEATQNVNKIFASSLINFFIIFILLHLAYKVVDMALLAIPVVLVLFTIYSSITKKKESIYHTSILVGGMLAAVVSYVLCLVNEETAEYWMHFAVSCAIAAFLGTIICTIIHNVIANRENIKALGFIGILLFFATIIGVPTYLYQKNPEEIYKFIFMKTTEVKAETEYDFIIKTLKNRYGKDFDCQSTNYMSNVQNGRKITQRECTVSGLEDKVTVTSLIYDENENQYIITDDYLDLVKLNDFRTKYATSIMNIVSGTKTTLYIYPKDNCTFIGDCAQSIRYQENYNNEVDLDKQYSASSKADYTKYLSMDAKDIINSGEYEYVIDIVGNYDDNITDYASLVDKVLEYLNDQGLKNTYGYEITISRAIGDDLQKEAYKVTGETNSDKTFNNPQVVTKNNENSNQQ